MTTTMHISHQKVKLYTVETSISGAIARLNGTYGLATICSIHTIFWFVQGGGGVILVCLLLSENHQNFSHSRLPNLLPVLLDIGSSHERNTLIVHCNSLAS